MSGIISSEPGSSRPRGTAAASDPHVAGDNDRHPSGSGRPAPEDRRDGDASIGMDEVRYLIATAGRAPSVHNTQPWRFRLVGNAVELRADPRRRLPRADPAGREMVISCGAALFGLRLAVRGLGYHPAVQLLADPRRPDVLARVGLGVPAPMSSNERALLAATTRRYTHRGAFTSDQLPPGLLAALQRDAEAEGATLVLLDRIGLYRQLAALVAVAESRQRRHAMLRAELRHWTRPPGSEARDGVPARAYPVGPSRGNGQLAMRDFDLGRGWGWPDVGGSPPAATAVLTTRGDGQNDWLHAGQALHRLLLHAASKWVFASLHTQPLENTPVRAEIRARLALPGAPQMLLQFGRADTAPVTARRPVGDLLNPH